MSNLASTLRQPFPSPAAGPSTAISASWSKTMSRGSSAFISVCRDANCWSVSRQSAPKWFPPQPLSRKRVGTFALVPQVVDAVKVPVIAAGGIADARGIVAAFALGAAAVQIGTAYLFCPEANVPSLHLAALNTATADDTMITDVFTGRPARGIVNRLMREQGPLSSMTPEFPLAAAALAPLRAKAEAAGSDDFTNLWSGQAVRLARRPTPAGEFTRLLARQTLDKYGVAPSAADD